MSTIQYTKNQNKQGFRQKKNLFRRCWYYFQGMVTTSIILVLCGVAIWGWQTLHNPKLFPFRHITFIGQFTHVSKNDLEKVVQLKLNGGFFVLNVTDMRQTLQSLPWVDQVEIQRIWPDVLKIRISEQQPIARWGQKALINDHLQIFIPPASTIPNNLPVLWGPEKYITLVIHYYVQIEAQLKTINLSVGTLSVNERKSWRLILNNGIEVILGQDDILGRCHRLVHLYPRIIRAKAADVARIDLRYSNGLAVKWKPQASSLTALVKSS